MARSALQNPMAWLERHSGIWPFVLPAGPTKALLQLGEDECWRTKVAGLMQVVNSGMLGKAIF
eukprot:620165-Lingulodinium_polyedra.AAC.1